MTAPLRWLLPHRLAQTAVLFALLAAGCSSDQSETQAGGPPRRPRPVPNLAGKEMFFDGQITAELSVGSGFDTKPAKESGETGSTGKHEGAGGGMHQGGGSHGGGHRADGNYVGDDGGSVSAQIDRDQMSLLRAAAQGYPPVMIHLRFTNNGPNQADLIIADFLSPLGNFVVEPEKLALTPGQTIEVEPMTSRLAGETSSANVTLALRLAGKGEKKTLTLKVVPDLPPADQPQSAAAPAATN